ncbi:PucR family transcriptional regulator [Streptomyces avermitilis]
MSGIVVRGGDGPVGEADLAGVALLSVDEDAAWHHVHLLLASAIGARPSPAGSGAALGDLFALADAVAAAVGGATAIEDPRQRILAYSTVPGQPVDEDRRQGILGLQVPRSPENTEQYRVLFAAQGAVRLPALGGASRVAGEPTGTVTGRGHADDGGPADTDADRAHAGDGRPAADDDPAHPDPGHPDPGHHDPGHHARLTHRDNLPRLAIAVRAGGETLGSLWVVDDGNLAPDAEQALAQGASTAALLLLRARAAQELARHQNGDLLRRLLDGTADPATAAHRLGFDAVRVAAFVLDSTAAAPDGEQTALRLLELVRLQCEARYGRHACVLVDGVVYALLPAPANGGGTSPLERGREPGGAARHRRLAEDIVRRAGQALRVPVRAGLGEVVPQLSEVTASRDDADLVLRVLGPGLPVASVDEVRPRVTLLRLAEVLRERRDLSAGSWRDVLAHDAGHGTDYARTLVAWFDSGCDMAGAAKLLAVHPNTCRYRLKQAQQQVGIDLDDPDERLVLWLQLRTLAGPTGASS